VNLIDLMNRMGQDKRFSLLGRLMLLGARKTRLSVMCRIAGRRLVSAFAGAPAILLTRSTMKDALNDPKLLYEAMTYTVREMGLDTLCLFADMSLEAKACGCQIQFDDINVPMVTTHPVKTMDDLATLRVPDPYRDGRMPVFLETMRLMKKNYNILKIGEVSGPFTLATTLAGTDMYLDIRRNPQKAKAILDYCEKVIIRYGQALIEAGADNILVAEPAGSQLSTPAYEDFSLAYTRRIIGSLSRPCILHVCGKAEHLIEKMCQSGAEAISVDDVDIASLIKQVPDNIVVIGNISPLEFAQGSTEKIENKTISLLEAVKNRKEFFLAPGCDLAPQTPLENILAFVKAAKECCRK
jgi:uroporphyrinogen decarboxylase